MQLQKGQTSALPAFKFIFNPVSVVTSPSDIDVRSFIFLYMKKSYCPGECFEMQEYIWIKIKEESNCYYRMVLFGHFL